MAENGEVLAALIDFRDFVAGQFGGVSKRLDRVDAELAELKTEVHSGFDRVDRRLGRLESRIEDLETRAKT